LLAAGLGSAIHVDLSTPSIHRIRASRTSRVAAVLLILLYLARLIVLDATSLMIVVPALQAGFIVKPIFYVWLGLSLERATR
jgi:hypothetical protein